MPISVAWDNTEQTILRYCLSGQWLWEDLENETSCAQSMLKNEPDTHCVSVIVVVEKETRFPQNVLAVARKRLLSRHGRVGIIVVVSGSFFVKALYNTLLRLEPSMAEFLQHTTTVERARTLIKDQLIHP